MKAGRLTHPAPTQNQNQCYNLAHPNIHLFFELLERVKGLDLQSQSYRISMTQGNNWISKRIPSSPWELNTKNIAEARDLELDQ